MTSTQFIEPEELDTLIEGAEGPRPGELPKLPAIRALEDITEKDMAPPPTLIDGMLLQGGKLLLSGPSKSRKTWLLLHLAAAAANGAEWLGFSTTRKNVLFIDLELMPFETPKRLSSIMERAGLWDKSGIAIWNLRGHAVNFNSIREGLREHVEKNEVGLICIDPYYRLANGADENSNSEIASFLLNIERLASETGAAVALTHHFAKGNSAVKSSIDRMSGAGTFARDPDALLSMTEGEDSTDEQPLFVIEPTVRSFPPSKPFAARWNFPLWERDDAASTGLKGSPGRPKKGAVAEIVELIPEGQELSAGEWKRAALENLDLSRGRFFELLAEAVESQAVEARIQGRNKYYRRKGSNQSEGINGPFPPHKQRGEP